MVRQIAEHRRRSGSLTGERRPSPSPGGARSAGCTIFDEGQRSNATRRVRRDWPRLAFIEMGWRDVDLTAPLRGLPQHMGWAVGGLAVVIGRR